MKEISLTKGYVALVDDDFYEVLNFNKWFVDTSKSTKTHYACRMICFGPERKKLKVKMHHAVLTLAGIVLSKETDHRDGNGLNNQLYNLRGAENYQNRQNVGIRKDNRSGYKGVFYNPQLRRWGAQIQSQKVRYRLGWFDKPEFAARAYNDAAKELHGSFAYLNEI